MTENVTVVRENKRLLKTDEKIVELMQRYKNININDSTRCSNQGIAFARQLSAMFQLARVITIGAYHRNESRGAHFKPEYPERDDDKWLKTTIATFNLAEQKPDFEYHDVDTSIIKPRKRDYTTEKKASGKA